MKKIKETPIVEKRMVEVETIVGVRTETVEEEGGLSTLLGKNILLICMNYFYYGKLTGVNGTVELENPYLVYETGSWSANKFANAEKLPSNKLYVKLEAVESYLEVTKTV